MVGRPEEHGGFANSNRRIRKRFIIADRRSRGGGTVFSVSTRSDYHRKNCNENQYRSAFAHLTVPGTIAND